MLDEMTQRNSSKFAIFYIGIQKTQSCFFISCYFTFFPNECRHRPGHSLGKKYSTAQNEKRKKKLGMWVFVFQEY